MTIPGSLSTTIPPQANASISCNSTVNGRVMELTTLQLRQELDAFGQQSPTHKHPLKKQTNKKSLKNETNSVTFVVRCPLPHPSKQFHT